MPKLTKKELCDKWLKNKTINPETSRKIKENGAVYKELEKKCSLNPLNQKDICDKWLKNKTINPETSRKIKENGTVYKELEKKCSLNPLNQIKEIKISSDKSFKTARTSFSKSENSETKRINAVKKIHKLFIPYVNRISANIIDRINYYIIMKKYLLTIKENNNCVRLYNIDKDTKKPIYRIGNKIILDKQLGEVSTYGIVFLSHFKTNIKYGTTFDKLNKFAVKITNQSKDNKKEIKVLKDLTKLVIDFKCPHFPISYGSFKCNNSQIKSDNLDDYSIIKDKHKNKQLFPYLINKNKSLLIQINELASGDFSKYLLTEKNTDKFNTISQVLLSIMFFHYYTNTYHNDAHTGNFLFHKIKPGGYFHYNIYGKDYYLENKGYMWVIWDFSLLKPFTLKNKYGRTYTNIRINYDYSYILNSLNYYKDRFTTNEYNFIELLIQTIINKYNNVYDYKLLKNIDKEILKFLIKNVSSFTTIKPSNIINKTPYIIGNLTKSSPPSSISSISSQPPPKVKKSYFGNLFSYIKNDFLNKNPDIIR